MSGALKAIGGGLGKVASAAAPLVSKIPGLGTIASPLLAAGGSLLQGQNIGQALGAGFGALNPFQLPFGLSSAAGGQMGGLLQHLGMGSSLTAQNIPGLGSPFGGQFGTGGFQLPAGFAQGQVGGYGQQGNFGFTPQNYGPTAAAPATQQSSPLDSLLNFIKDPKNLALLGLGAGGAALASKSGILDPRVVNDPRNNTDNAFNALLSQGLQGPLGQILSTGQLPQYGGQFAAGPNDTQTGAVGGLQSIIGQLSGGSQGQDILSQLMGMSQSGQQLNLPPELQALLGAGGQGNSILQGIGQGTDPVSQLLMQMGGGGQQAQQGLMGLAGSSTNPFLQQLAQSGGGMNPALMALMGFQPQGGQGLNQFAGAINDPYTQALQQAGQQQNPAIQQLLGFQSQTPERQMLLQAGMQDPTQGGQGLIGQGAGLLQSLASSPQMAQLLSGGQGADINQIGQMLTQASNPGLQDNISQLREQFSFNGLRNSTDLNQGVSNLMARNQSNIQGALAGIIPGLTQNANQTALGAGGLLQSIGSQFGNLGSAAGNLGLGGQQNVLNAFGTAGNLGQGSAQQILQALSAGGGLQQQQNQLGLAGTQAASQSSQGIQQLIAQVLGQAGSLNQGGSAQQLQAILGGGNIFGNQQALNQQGLQGAATGLTGQQNLIQSILSQAGQLGIAGGGQQSSALQALLGAQSGAGTALNQGGNQQLDILSRLFGTQQGNATQAATSLPGAFTSIQSLLPALLGQQFNQGTTLQNNAQTGIQNQLSQFNQGNSLIPQILQYLQSTPQQQVGPSLLSQLGGILTQGAVAKQLK